MNKADIQRRELDHRLAGIEAVVRDDNRDWYERLIDAVED